MSRQNRTRIEFAPAILPVLSAPLGTYRYRVLRGGRGSGKSFSVAKMSAVWGAQKPIRILCTREFQNSIKQSFYAEVANAIKSEPILDAVYDVGRDYIRHRANGTEFLFAGLRHNIDSIKSMAQIDLCIVEEAEQVPHASWQALIPTVRAPGSEIIVIYNPRRRDSWVAQQFDGDKLPPRTKVVTVNHDSNPWFGKELEEQRQYDMEVMDPALYRHIWEGAYYEQSDAQIFAGKYRIGEFEPLPHWDGPYYGIDWGFSQDPTVGVKCWVGDDRLWIEYEAGKVGLENDDIATHMIKHIPGVRMHTVRADSARPETISHVKSDGGGRRDNLPKIVGVEKWAGSVEDGISHLRSYREIVIHPRCSETANEAALYSYKVDRLSGDVLTAIIDKYNHYFDAIRYALGPLIKRKGDKSAGVVTTGFG